MDRMRTSSDSVPIALILTAFVLMFIGEASYERLAEAWLLARIEPWLGAGAAEVVERFAALAVAGAISLYVTAALYLHLRRQFASESAQAGGSPARPPQRDVWLYDAICRISSAAGRRSRSEAGGSTSTARWRRFCKTSSAGISGSSAPTARSRSGDAGAALGVCGSWRRRISGSITASTINRSWKPTRGGCMLCRATTAMIESRSAS